MLRQLIMLVLIGCSTAAYAAQFSLDTLKQLAESGQYEEAFSLADAGLERFEGNPQFDFYYGLSALETGRYTEAVFALERVVLNNPGQRRVRLELARAHYLAGNYPAARREFELVRESNPPAEVRRNIDAFMRNIDQAESGQGRQIVLFAEMYSGYDSNINSATDDGSTDIPVNGGTFTFDLPRGGQETDNGFLRANGGVQFSQPLNKNRAVDAAFYASRKENLSDDNFDLTFWRVESGVTERFGGNNQIRLSVGAQRIGLNTTRFQHASNLGVDYARQLENGLVVNFGSRISFNRFNNDALRNTNQYLFRGGVGGQFGKASHRVTLFGAVEPQRGDDAGEHNGRNFVGATYNLQRPVRSDVIPFARVTVQSTEFDEDQPTFAKTREDTFVSAQVGTIWRINNDLTARGQLTYANQDSNIDLFEYDRFLFEIGITYARQ